MSSPPRVHKGPLAINLLATACLAALIGLGIYVNLVRLVVGGQSTRGFPVINVNAKSWNVGCTVLGTAVGLLLTRAFSSHDDLLTRRDLLSRDGVLALYLRPLSAQRGVQQLQRGRTHPARTLLVLASVISTLTTAATVAIFGIHTESIGITNPLASYPLSAFPASTFVQDPDGAIFGVQVKVYGPPLNAFLYDDAYSRSLQAQPVYDPLSTEFWIPKSTPLGNTIYPTFNTSGIGLNMTSYTQFSGFASGYDMPTSYVFERLDAVVFGTNVNVECVNASDKYSYLSPFDGTGAPGGLYSAVFFVWKPDNSNFPNTTLVVDKFYQTGAVIGSVVTIQEGGQPLHTLIFPELADLPFILECTYGGSEFTASITLQDRISPFQVNGIVDQGPQLDVPTQQMLANLTSQYLNGYSHGGPGGALADGCVASQYLSSSYTDHTNTSQVMSTILSEFSQAYFSLLRQKFEVANLYLDAQQIQDNGNGSTLTMLISVLRVGGASWGWLAVYGVLLIVSLLGAVMTLAKKMQGHVASWEVQDPVGILQRCLPDSNIDEITPLRFGETFEVATAVIETEPLQSGKVN